MLRSSLVIGTRQSKQKIRVRIRETTDCEPHIIGPAGEVLIVPINFKKQKLVEALPSDVAPKLNCVLPNRFRKIIRPLKRIACLGQLAFEVVSDCKAPGDVHIWNALMAGNS